MRQKRKLKYVDCLMPLGAGDDTLLPLGGDLGLLPLGGDLGLLPLGASDDLLLPLGEGDDLLRPIGEMSDSLRPIGEMSDELLPVRPPGRGGGPSITPEPTGRGPVGAFSRKISKLNTKSPNDTKEPR
jgi:hypothetical protein